MEGLHGELRRLGFKPGRANVEMGRREPERELITDPARVEKLKVIAQAYNTGSITALQAAMLAQKV